MHVSMNILTRPIALLAIAAALSGQPAWGVLLSSGNGNTDSASLITFGGPGALNTPGFVNVGRNSTGNASVTYLGNRWVITAAHVNIDNNVGPVRFGGNNYTIDTNSITQLYNPDNTTLADLKVFRITTDPGLPSILPSLISSTTPVANDQVVMIGNGVSTTGSETWEVDTTNPNDWHWQTLGTQPPYTGPNVVNYSGFFYDNNHTIRWGANAVQDAGIVNNMAVFTTEFQPGQNIGQASPGDSGGAVFSYLSNQWVLSGIMVGTSDLLNHQPGSTALYGDLTYAMDLSAYRSQILSIVPEPSSVVLAMIAAAGLAMARFRRRR